MEKIPWIYIYIIYIYLLSFYIYIYIYINQIALTKYLGNFNDQGLIPQIKWKIVRQSSTANSFIGRCNFCIDEKISIINFKDRRLLLNECNELVFRCRHKGKFKLSWLRATEAATLDKNMDIDFRYFYWK